MTFLKKYRHVLGIEKKGAHSVRFLDTALVDYILTILLSFTTTYIFNIPAVLTTIFWFSIGVVIHYIFGVQTKTLAYLNLVF